MTTSIAINVKDHGAIEDNTTNCYTAFVNAIAVCKAQKRPLYVPGNGIGYKVLFSRDYNNALGRLLIDFPDFQILGDGPSRSIINFRASTTPARRVSHVDHTIVRGRIATVSGTSTRTITFQTPADSANFRQGDMIWVAQNADGSGERGMIAGALDFNVTPRITSTNADIASTQSIVLANCQNMQAFAAGDHVFIRWKVTLQTGQAANIDAGSGFLAGPNSDGTGLRPTGDNVPVKITFVDTATNTISYQGMNNEVSGFANNDYLFIKPAYRAFYFASDGFPDLPADSLTTPYNSLFKDIKLTGDIYPASHPEDENNSILNYLVWVQPNNSTTLTVPTTRRFENVHFNGTSAGVFGGGRGNQYVTYELDRCVFEAQEFCNVQIYGSELTEDRRIYLHARDTEFRSTGFSHNAYLHCHVSFNFDNCLFDNTGPDGVGHGEGIDHWGVYRAPREAVVQNCYFGPGIKGRAYMTSTNGQFVFANNVVESRYGVAARCSGNIIGNEFRPRMASATACTAIFQYTLTAENILVNVLGNHCDMANALSSTMTFVSYASGHWIIDGNSASAELDAGPNYNDYAGPAEYTSYFTFVANSTAAFLGSSSDGPAVEPATAIVSNNHLQFKPTATNQHLLARLLGATDITIKGNRAQGSALSTNYGLIMYDCWNNAGSGRIEIIDNFLDASTGHGIYRIPYPGVSMPSVGRVSASVDPGDTNGAIQLQTGTLSTFWVGKRFFASPNSDASSPRSGVVTVASTSTGPDTVNFTGTITGLTTNDYLFEYWEPKLVIKGNRILNRTASRHGIYINMPQVPGATYEISDNVIEVQPTGTALILNAPANSVIGENNLLNTGLTGTQVQQLRPARRKNTAVIPAYASVNLSASYDTFVLSDAGAVTIDRIGFGSVLSQQAFDGAEITLVFSTGNITLGAGSSPAAWAANTPYAVGVVRTNAGRLYQCIAAGTSAGSGGPTTQAKDIPDGTAHWMYLEEGTSLGNLNAAGGARAAGSACRLTYVASLGKWVEM